MKSRKGLNVDEWQSLSLNLSLNFFSHTTVCVVHTCECTWVCSSSRCCSRCSLWTASSQSGHTHKKRRQCDSWRAKLSIATSLWLGWGSVILMVRRFFYFGEVAEVSHLWFKVKNITLYCVNALYFLPNEVDNFLFDNVWTSDIRQCVFRQCFAMYYY